LKLIPQLFLGGKQLWEILKKEEEEENQKKYLT